MPRPRKFDINDALAAATGVFLRHGFDGASLEDLTAAMGINKPSLYAAFGDKDALYAKVLEGYGAMAKSAMGQALAAGGTMKETVRAFLLGAIEAYAPAKGPHLGCLIATTATTAAGSSDPVREELATFLGDVDQLIHATLQARFGKDLSGEMVAVVSDILISTMFSLAIRARAGTSRKKLTAIAERAVVSVGALTAA